MDFNFIDQELEEIKSARLYRELKTFSFSKTLLNFSSNNYLGLSQDPRVIEAGQKALAEFGTGGEASRLVTGTTVWHNKLEKEIASFKKRERSLVYPTGYMANIGVITALISENDLLIIDKLNHASIIDACKLSKGTLRVYKHKDMESLEKILKESESFKKKLIVTDAVFSMDGDIAPLPQIISLAKKYGAFVMVDEAHSIGVIGKTGRGIEEHFGLDGEVEIVMGTLSKAIGALGGYVAGSQKLIEYLINKSRSFIYTTALPSHICASAYKSFEIIKNEPELLATLHENIKLFESISKIKTESAIIPIIIGDETKALAKSKELLSEGFLVSPIRYPTVAKGSARLRVTISANHKRDDIERLAGLVKIN